jgi:DNA-binding MarR family transcriptional regulator
MNTDVLLDVEHMTGFLIERSSKRMKQVCQQILKEKGFNITVDQWVVLQELNKNDGQGQIALANSTFKDAPTITRIIDLLCQKGYVERINNPDDRRRFKICLTQSGDNLISDVGPHILEFRKKAYAGLNQAQLANLKQSLNHIFDNLNAI